MTIAEVAADNYRQMGECLEREARQEKADGRPLHARIAAQRALIAFRAAKAEEADMRARA